MRRALTVAVAVAGLLGAVACAHRAPSATARLAPATPTLPAGVDVTVERVVDGDTVVVSGPRTVRLIGVDTPPYLMPRKPSPEESTMVEGAEREQLCGTGVPHSPARAESSGPSASIR